jgi:hypothetical protein
VTKRVEREVAIMALLVERGATRGGGGGVDYNAIKSLAFFFTYSIFFYEAKILTKIYTSFYSAEFSCVETRNDSKEIKSLPKDNLHNSHWDNLLYL